MTKVKTYTEAAFETVVVDHLLSAGYVPVEDKLFERERAVFPSIALQFIQETQPKQWVKLEALHSDKIKEKTYTEERVNEGIREKEIQAAFKTDFEGAEIGEEGEPSRMYEIRADLDASGVYTNAFAAFTSNPKPARASLIIVK